MTRPPKHWAPIPVDSIVFNFSGADDRFGLPIVSGPEGQLPIFDVPSLVERAPELSVEDIAWPWGAELAAASIFSCRAWNTIGDPPRLVGGLQLSDGIDFPQFLRTTLRIGLPSPAYSYFAELGLWLQHGAVCDSQLIHGSELDALTPEIFEARLRAILRGERVPEPWIRHSLID